jgi:nucleotide-binding universal stress UspA family protein
VLDTGALEKQVLARLERRMASLAGSSAVRCTVTTGNPGQRIAAAADDSTCVVMPTSGRTGAAHALIGSVAERVVRLARVPVLVLPPSRPRPRRRSHDR